MSGKYTHTRTHIYLASRIIAGTYSVRRNRMWRTRKIVVKSKSEKKTDYIPF